MKSIIRHFLSSKMTLSAASLIVLVATMMIAAPFVHADDTLTIDAPAGPVTIKVELAVTAEDQARGLMFRNSLAERHGMLFDFGEEREVSMWMKNTLIPLDMIFIRADGTIHRIAENTEPLSLDIVGSQGDVKAVLEIAGGSAKALGIVPGAKVHHPIFYSAE